ncbi:hypothetical protein F5144DRAFT_45020 [Chaetomium tenue]|uniref:Uncharacterized protein n=1 Tax=Chaetomium tenue TaxID=1854479 RepID=A0ACB7PMH4_9PEZI|nr:hypothetical protein F5144DRAFT_45020 [Chaetomium globosum]
MAYNFPSPLLYPRYYYSEGNRNEGSGDATGDTNSSCDTPGTSKTGDDDSGLNPAPASMPPRSFDGPESPNKGNIASTAKPTSGTIQIRIIPAIPSAKPWAACIKIKCKDVPRLMREGFFWSADNVLPERGHISPDTGRAWVNLGCRHQRTWIIADDPDDEVSQWRGSIKVVSPVLEALAKFRTHHLSKATVYCASAWNEMGRSIYKYDYRRPDDNYNCIYDDKPLKGWWPWPKQHAAEMTTPVGDESQLFPHRTRTFPARSLYGPGRSHYQPDCSRYLPKRDPDGLYLPRPPFELSARTMGDCFDNDDDDDDGEDELVEKSVVGSSYSS